MAKTNPNCSKKLENKSQSWNKEEIEEISKFFTLTQLKRRKSPLRALKTHFFTWKWKWSFLRKLKGTRILIIPPAMCRSSNPPRNYHPDIMHEFPPIYTQAHMLGMCYKYQPIQTLKNFTKCLSPHSTSCRAWSIPQSTCSFLACIQHRVTNDNISHIASNRTQRLGIWCRVSTRFEEDQANNPHAWKNPTRHLIAHDIPRVYVECDSC